MKYIKSVFGLSAAALLCVNAYGQQPQKKPNILWISTEDMSPHLGCYGDNAARTPNIDKLASQGVRYTNVFTTAAISAPCRAGIITGMYQTSIGCMHMRTTSYRRSVENPIEFTAVPPHYVKTFTEYLRAAGYYCTNNSKTDYQFATDPVPASIWDECSRNAHYKNRPDKNQPFFAVFNWNGTHESQNWNIKNVKTDLKKIKVPPYYPDNEIIRKNLAKMYDNIARLDSVVGSIVNELEREGELDNTIIFFWGDHGDGLPRCKRWLYDSGLNIPLIIKWPDKSNAGTIDDRLISSIDFGPTVLSLAGVPVPAHMQGIPFLGPQTGEPRDAVFAARDRVDESYDMIRSVRTKNYLYIRNYYPNEPFPIWVPYLSNMPIYKEMLRLDAEGKLTGPQKAWMAYSRPPEELYDVKADPYQINNLVNDQKLKSVLDDLRKRHEKWTLETGDMGHLNELEMIEQMWPGGKQPVTDIPYFIINSPEDPASKNYRTGGTYSTPMTLGFYCPTHGSSLVYTFEETKNPRWLLYTGPLHLKPGNHNIRVKAVRYGYKDSEELKGTFIIK
ncbi:MAG TPA: sulfatase-like hydrolase/transferase [Bacteroidales bacterium]|nr:sulfatase-like hydrolase/transferase [Bacteroidales bacterium]HOU97091.1 sulfatase-like hydrolase/transferase [Bacteroidales bacterium]HQG36654.1 sulfatase-like hydrolase/transferase [Bacteroidales bacterium]HQG52786.1 sulfatase-like hydrolase/transferase [Bacteroidales bacterium]HQJ20762.1 sulfatase-like hydrolase/transferase [Bacteroidales bacterium]